MERMSLIHRESLTDWRRGLPSNVLGTGFKSKGFITFFEGNSAMLLFYTYFWALILYVLALLELLVDVHSTRLTEVYHLPHADSRVRHH